MTSLDPSAPWHDERWRERGDNPLQAGLRQQQAWWRQECLVIPEAGHLHPVPKKGERQRRRNPVVSSMLPESVDGFAANLMTDEAIEAYTDAKQGLEDAPGLIHDDRLRRDLLASQPLSFNIFGYLSKAEPDALLGWVRSYSPEAASVVGIRLVYAPSREELGAEPLGGAAFDAFIEYARTDGRLGFIGVEMNYHEDLGKGLTIPPEGSALRATYVAETAAHGWPDGAADELLTNRRNLQFWYHQLLAQRTATLVKADDGTPKYAEHTVVVVASRYDTSARSVAEKVASLLVDQGTLRFCALDDVIGQVTGHEPWKHSMWQRYTDFTPIQRELAAGSPLRL
ncbi:hypothetical protein BH09ACT12_BH09ACT12_19640 [soil metagenome]